MQAQRDKDSVDDSWRGHSYGDIFHLLGQVEAAAVQKLEVTRSAQRCMNQARYHFVHDFDKGIVLLHACKNSESLEATRPSLSFNEDASTHVWGDFISSVGSHK